MIVDYSPSGGLSLVEAEDFKGFKLRIAGAETRPAIDGVTFVDDGNVLIGVDRVPALPGAVITSRLTRSSATRSSRRRPPSAPAGTLHGSPSTTSITTASCRRR